MPQSATSPLTLGAGQTVGGTGTIQGSVRFGSGAVVDFGDVLPSIDDVQLAGCTLRFPAANGGAFALPGVSSVTGSITVDVSAWKGAGAIPPRVNLLQLDPAVVDDATVFTQMGLRSNSTIIFNRETGLLQLVTLKGFIISVK